MKTSYLFLAFFLLTIMLFFTAFLYGDARLALLGLVIPVTAAYARASFSGELRDFRINADRKILDLLSFQGRAISIMLEVENLGPMQSLLIEDVLPEDVELAQGSNKLRKVMRHGEKVSQQYTIRPLKRGYLKMEEVRVTVFDRTGLFSSEVSIPEESEIVVHVKEESLMRGIALAKRERLELTHFSQQRWLRTKDFEFDGIRDYVPGDKFRDIHWKSLAKLQKLLTKFYRREAMIPTTILLDCSRSMRLTKTDAAKIDHGVHLSLEISKILLAGYHPTGVVLFDELGVIDMLSPSTKKTQFERLLMVMRSVPPHVGEMVPAVIKAELETGGQVKAETADGGEPRHIAVDKEAEPFLSTIAQFSSAKGMRQSKVGLEGIMRADLSRGKKKSHLFILISDLEASRDSVLKSCSIAVMNRHKMVLATPFGFWYEASKERSTTIDELEKAYLQFSSKVESERILRRLGVIIIDIGPRDEAFKITRAVRRRLS